MRYSIRITSRTVPKRVEYPYSLYPYDYQVYVQLREGRRPLTPPVSREGDMEDQLVQLAESVGLSPSPFLTAWERTKQARKVFRPWWDSYYGSTYDKQRQSYTLVVE